MTKVERQKRERESCREIDIQGELQHKFSIGLATAERGKCEIDERGLQFSSFGSATRGDHTP